MTLPENSGSDKLTNEWSLVRRLDVTDNAYDMEDGSTTIRLSRLTRGQWRFDELVLSDGSCLHGIGDIHSEGLRSWLNEKADGEA